ncbi:MAG: queuine tRNA-ribosyltransferase family protein [Desulfurococcales archaeon]|nr:queuine tRNA-ribosyltransferase family protein [Desulfurococcales archaeon]
MSVELFLVLPDLGGSKVEALRSLCVEGVRASVLVSYTVLRWKPGMMPRLSSLRGEGCLGRVMLDSGAYHLMRLGERVDPGEYAEFARSAKELWDIVVAPDAPGKPGETLERTLEFASSYSGSFMPVLQGEDEEGYARLLRSFEREGLTDRAPRASEGRPVIGIGGLDGERKRVGYVSRLLKRLPEEYSYHLFGVGIRVLRGLRRRGLLGRVYSVDSSGWLAEIWFRRRTVYGASGVVEANLAAMRAYIGKAQAAVG